MPEFFSSFPSLDIKPQPQMSASDIMNIGRTGIQYQKESQGNTERLALQELFSNPENFTTDGNIDLGKVMATVPKIAPMTGRDVIRNVAELSQAQTNAIQAKQNLTQTQRGIVGQVFNILGKAGVNDRDAYFKALDDTVKTNPDNPDLAKLADSYKTIWSKMPENTNWSQLAVTGAQTLLPVSSQETLYNPQPGTLNTGAGTFQTVTRPSVAGQAPSTQVGNQPIAINQLGPGQRMVPTNRTDLNGNPTALVYGPNGEMLGEVTIQGGVSPGAMPGAQVPSPTGAPTSALPPTNVAPPANAPFRVPAGENAATLDAANNLRMAARTTAATVPNQIFNNNQIIKLADEVTTGKGASTLANLTGGYAYIPWSSDNAANLNKLGDYMAKQQVQLSQGAGISGSDAGRALAGETVGTTEWTAPAIKHTARVNRALATATELFNQGVDTAFNRTKNPFSSTEFQQRWIKELGTDGINAIRLYDATLNNDKEGIREVVTSIGGKDSAEYKKLVLKIGGILKLAGAQ
jgi:hypothetical protein